MDHWLSMRAIFIDIETTGLDPTCHRSLEIACKVVDLSSGGLIAAYDSVIKQPLSVWQASDPVSLGVNGFKWEDLQQGCEESQVAEQLVSFLQSLKIMRGNACFIAQNPTFDRAFFAQLVPIYRQEQLHLPYHWLDFASMYWALRVQALRSGKLKLETPDINLSKDFIAKEYGLEPEPQPHRAMNGVDHLIHCYSRVVGWISS